jgi:O-antigen/teichoic acid export membrane protein
MGGSLLAGALVQLVFGGSYAPAGAPLRILLWCIPVGLLRSVAHSALIARGRQDQLLLSVAWAAGINLILNFALIPRWGMTGAAIATVGTETVRATLALRYCGRGGLRFPSLRRFWRVLLAGGLMGGILALAGIGPLWLAIPVGGLVYLLGLYLLGGLSFPRGALPELTV